MHLDKRELRSWEVRRAVRRRRRQRQIIRRSLFVIAGFMILLTLGFKITAIKKEDPSYPAEDEAVKIKKEDGDQMLTDYPDEKEDKEDGEKDGEKDGDEKDSDEKDSDEEDEKEDDEVCIVLDAGHGGQDSGTLWGNIYEKDINLAITKKLKVILEEAGYQVVMTRNGDNRTVLKERVRIAEENHAAAFVSIHQNALKNDTATEGIQVFYNPLTNRYSKTLADYIHSKLLEATGARDKGSLENDELYVLNHSTVPACLVETGFLTAKRERKRLLDEGYQQQIAEGIAEGILAFLG